MYTATPQQMKTAEANAVSKGTSYLQLMENAGAAATAEILKRIPHISGKKALILSGKGNNGGDGFVMARLLSEKGACVTVSLAAEPPCDGIAFEEYSKITAISDIEILPLSDTDFSAEYDIIADAVFGTGFHGELPESISSAMKRLSHSDALKIAVDIPSGADSISGKCSEGTLSCDVTVTFGAVKTGMLHSPAKKLCGEIITAPIGIDDECFEGIEGICELMDMAHAAKAVPIRGEQDHKGNFGKLLIIAGSEGMSGAAAMNVSGALRSGAGLVKLASVPEVIDRTGSGIYECTFCKLIPTPDGYISADNVSKLLSEAEKMTCISIGSGMGATEDSTLILQNIVRLCGEKNIPLIIDADGLNCLAGCIDIIRNAECRAVLTPHPGELGRLLGISAAEVLSDRQAAAMRLAELTGAVVCAKGYPTYIVSPEGKVRASFTGNGGLSRGGSGDVLTGIISGLVTASSHGIYEDESLLFEAACAGVYIFGLAADIAAEKLSMTGMLPTDAVKMLPEAYKKLVMRS
ncbi:MAG: NAD(P)H-hydrate dehydratase [Huintestinicola sp.]|uniref:NAD(P)H-hydrate dehydratase n=1 Tax=Huintestinicola sp. TaxID=2981661 RepID=UPI003F1054F1